jgi:hypothetical protein
MDDEEEEGKDVFISFDTIEGPAETCLDICAETCNVMLMLTGYAVVCRVSCVVWLGLRLTRSAAT